MRTTFGRQQVLHVLQVVPGPEVEIYRIVRAPTQDDPAMLDSLRSHYELERAPRGAERTSTVIHMGISAYLEKESARETARRFPKIGDHIARLVLHPGNGFNLAHTGPPRHLTIWGDPGRLCGAILDIEPV